MSHLVWDQGRHVLRKHIPSMTRARGSETNDLNSQCRERLSAKQSFRRLESFLTTDETNGSKEKRGGSGSHI